jgi:hypothetical protein
LHKKKDEAEAGLLVIKERRARAVKGRQATKGEEKTFAVGDDQHSKVSTSLPVTSLQPVALSATATLDQRRVRHGTVDTAAQLHECKGARGKGERILLKGITGDTVKAERADVVFPVTTIEGKRYACESVTQVRSRKAHHRCATDAREANGAQLISSAPSGACGFSAIPFSHPPFFVKG